MLIWGWRSLLKVLGVGEFHCPRCNADRPYRLVRPRRWFTVFFIPVIPLKWGETFVECGHCKAGFREQVLQAPTNAQFSFVLALAARAMYAKTVAVAFPHDSGMADRAVAQLQPFTDPNYNSANFAADLEAFAGHDLAGYLQPIAGSMSMPGREQLVGGLVMFATVDGRVSAEAYGCIGEVARALEITPAHLAGIQQTALAALQPPPEAQ